MRAAGSAAMVTAAVEVRAGLTARVEVTLARLESLAESVTVTAGAFVQPEEIKSSSFLATGEEIFKSAGTLQDVSRYVQTLPGVVIGSDDFRNDIIVRGGSPLENLFIVDNVEIPNINAFANFASAGGTVGILDAALIQDATFLTGGYPAPFINRTSSVLQVTQREGNRNRFGGRATLGFAGAGAILEGPFAKGRGSWISSARRSFLDLFTEDIGVGGVPAVYTFNNKIVYDLSPRDRIWGVSITGVDRIRLGARQDKTLDSAELNNLDIRYQGWRSANGFSWQRLFGSRGVGLLGVSHSVANVDQQVKDLVYDSVPPDDVTVDDLIARSPVVFRDDSREGESTIKYDLTAYAGALGKLQAGGSLKVFRIRYDLASPLGSDSPYSLDRTVNAFALRQKFTATQTGAYLQSSRNLTPRLNVTWGGRVDKYGYIGRTRFSPRAGVSYRITNKLSWRANYGSYYQQPYFVFLSSFPENRGLAPWRADHYVTGFSYVLNGSLRMTIEGYRKNYKDYPVSTQFPSLSLASIGDTFDVREILFPLTSAGRGRAEGVELFIEKKFTDRWFGQMNLSFSRTRQSGLDGKLRPGSFDYPRVFNVIGGYRLTKNWELSARVAYLAGRPYTPFDVAESTRQRRPIFDLRRVNAQRLPEYVRIDVRLDRTFMVHDKPLLIFVGAQNAIGRKNVASYTWDRRANTIQANEQTGVFPLIGMEWRF
ncbi:MAG: TonB-dependent receptor [Acidobacteriota bacterium]